MPVIQCPVCKRSLNLKQMPTAPRIKCPGCSNPITISEAAVQSKPAQPSGRGPLTPEDEGFNFGQIQFPAAGPVAVSTFQTGNQPLNVYQGPIPGDPLGDQVGGEEEEIVTEGKAGGASKGKGKLSRTALVAILGGTATLLVVAIVVGTLIAGGGAVDPAASGSGGGEQVSE